MKIGYSPSGQVLYLRLRSGEVAETVESEALVVVDLDDAGEPLGIDFVVADHLFSFLARHAAGSDGLAVVELPDGLAALVREQALATTA